ncbi:6-phosphogluconate dehydrogenase C-terminal domain-like protein [Phlebopus sp. FC_14]|nr:6-phosphogluconate dehydrogenase C-terminal domain-like protein [Phlebopus sp. FC_14]
MTAPTTPPRIAIVAAGMMGAAVAGRLTKAGCTVYTNLDGRSAATRQRAKDAGMIDVPLTDLVANSDWILSIIPPRDAVSFAEQIQAVNREVLSKSCVFVDCNAINPETAKRIAMIFIGGDIKFVDACIFGPPPKDDYDPTFYASTATENSHILDEFAALSQYGLKVSLLRGEGVGVGDASALKMSFSGVFKGALGTLTTMILAAHASSPATADALLKELVVSQPVLLDVLVKYIHSMFPRAYRWVGEMEEISQFVGGEEGDVYRGLARVFKRVDKSLQGDQVEVDVLKKFVEDVEKMRHAE